MGPIVYGALTDSACSIWQTECGEQTSCWVYDNFTVRRNYFIVAVVFKVFSVISFFLASVLYKPPRQENSLRHTASNGDKSDATFTNIAFTGEKL